MQRDIQWEVFFLTDWPIFSVAFGCWREKSRWKKQRALFMSVRPIRRFLRQCPNFEGKNSKIFLYSFDTVLLEPFTCDEEGRNTQNKDDWVFLIFFWHHRLNLDEIGGRVSNVDWRPFPVLSIKSCADSFRCLSYSCYSRNGALLLVHTRQRRLMICHPDPW